MREYVLLYVLCVCVCVCVRANWEQDPAPQNSGPSDLFPRDSSRHSDLTATSTGSLDEPAATGGMKRREAAKR